MLRPRHSGSIRRAEAPAVSGCSPGPRDLLHRVQLKLVPMHPAMFAVVGNPARRDSRLLILSVVLRVKQMQGEWLKNLPKATSLRD